METEEVQDEEVIEDENIEEDELDSSVEDEEKVIEPWMEEDEGDQTPDESSNNVPVGKLVHVKRKLKGKISERDDEIAQLKNEIAELKQPQQPQQETLNFPVKDDFDTEQEYREALETYFDERAERTYAKNQHSKTQQKAQQQAVQQLKESVDSHYERVDVLLTDSGIKPELYKNADQKVREAIETIRPKEGDLIVDQAISALGKGSEKVLFYLGRNKPALRKFQSLLASDKSGMKAVVYLGQEQQRLTNPKKPRSQAPSPAPNVEGDVSSEGGASLKRKYKAAHGKKNSQKAYEIKKQARKQGVDVSTW